MQDITLGVQNKGTERLKMSPCQSLTAKELLIKTVLIIADSTSEPLFQQHEFHSYCQKELTLFL